MHTDNPAAVTRFLTYMKAIYNRSPKTVAEYELDLRMFFRFLKLHRSPCDRSVRLDEFDISDVDEAFLRSITLYDIYEFLSYLSDQFDDGAATRARKVSCLRSFFKYLTKTNVLEQNPAEYLESPKKRDSLPKYLSLDESVQLLTTVDGTHKERDFAILTLFLNCGMRLSELVGINLDSISLSDRTLRVLGKGNKERMLPLNDACVDALQHYLPRRPNSPKEKRALFLSQRGTRISTKTVQWLVKKHLDEAGLKSKNYSTHKLRHTAATLMFQHGDVDVRTLQEFLGHEQLSTTQIYTHVGNAQIREAAERNPLGSFRMERAAAGRAPEPEPDGQDDGDR